MLIERLLSMLMYGNCSQMQALLREAGEAHMAPDDYQKFVSEHKNAQLVKPEDPGYVIASMALKASPSLSGQFVSWNSEECKDYDRKQ